LAFIKGEIGKENNSSRDPRVEAGAGVPKARQASNAVPVPIFINRERDPPQIHEKNFP
jgi:hypothetical protein